MANELLKNSEGDAVPQKLADDATISGVDLNGDESVWTIFQDPAQGGGATLNDIVDQLENGEYKIGTINDSISLEVEDGEGSFAEIYRTANALHVYLAGQAVDITTKNASDKEFENGTVLPSGNTLTTPLSQVGAQKLSGIVTRDATSYDVEVAWLDADSGDVVIIESIASGVASGDQTTFDIPARSPYAEVRVVDSGGGDGLVTASYHLR